MTTAEEIRLLYAQTVLLETLSSRGRVHGSACGARADDCLTCAPLRSACKPPSQQRKSPSPGFGSR